LLSWQYVTQTFAYKSINLTYTNFIGQLAVWIANLLGQFPTFDSKTYHLSLNDRVKLLIIPTESYRFYVIGFILLLLVPIKEYKYSFLLLVSSLLFIALRAAFISIIQLIYPQDIILLLWIDPFIYIPMVVIILFVSTRNQLIKPLYDRICALFKPLLIVSVPTLILVLLLVTPIPRVLFNYLDKGIIDGLTTITLQVSKIMLKWFDYKAVVSANFLFLGKFWLQLEQPCLGIGVVTIVWILVCFIKSQWLNKSIFLILFSLLFVIMNSIRMSVLLLVIKNTYLTGLNKVVLHDNITYFMYIFAFVSFLIYYFWFQDLKWRKTN
jgi:exosortase/archaeosortase family protein